jgi:hypothetical protein
MTDLLSYIIEMPSESDSHERAHKYPFALGEMFAIDNNSLLDVFFEEEKEESSDEDSEPNNSVQSEPIEVKEVPKEESEDMKTNND